MTLNGIMAIILRYFTEFGRFRGALRKMVEDVVKNFTFAISSRDEFLGLKVSSVADLEGAEPAPPPPLGRQTDAVTVLLISEQ